MTNSVVVGFDRRPLDLGAHAVALSVEPTLNPLQWLMKTLGRTPTSIQSG